MSCRFQLTCLRTSVQAESSASSSAVPNTSPVAEKAEEVKIEAKDHLVLMFSCIGALKSFLFFIEALRTYIIYIILHIIVIHLFTCTDG